MLLHVQVCLEFFPCSRLSWSASSWKVLLSCVDLMISESTEQCMCIKFYVKVRKISADICVMQCIMKGLKSVNLASNKFTMTVYAHVYKYSPKFNISQVSQLLCRSVVALCDLDVVSKLKKLERQKIL
jgi:hypothetical protein